MVEEAWPSCPAPLEADTDVVTLSYGEGGRLSRRFIGEHVLPRLGNEVLNRLGDAAELSVPSGRLAFTTDSYVVSPLFFPGGDIGRLAVFGTVNDLAVSGARPLWISLSMIIEEGLPWKTLDVLLDSIREAAVSAGVAIATGDTRVVPRGAVDQVFLNTAGIGERWANAPAGVNSVVEGDVILVSGPIGQHGVAILAARQDFGFDPRPRSDCGSVSDPLQALADCGLTPKLIRDATRGGVAAVLHEWAGHSGHAFSLDETSLPVTSETHAVCELLGLDPLHIACEGRFLAVVPSQQVARTLEVLRRFSISSSAVPIGRVVRRRVSPVTVVRAAGLEVPLDEPAGAPLPRIC